MTSENRDHANVSSKFWSTLRKYFISKGFSLEKIASLVEKIQETNVGFKLHLILKREIKIVCGLNKTIVHLYLFLGSLSFQHFCMCIRVLLDSNSGSNVDLKTF